MWAHLSILCIVISQIGSTSFKVQKCCGNSEILNDWYECESSQIEVLRYIRESCHFANCSIETLNHLVCPKKQRLEALVRNVFQNQSVVMLDELGQYKMQKMYPGKCPPPTTYLYKIFF